MDLQKSNLTETLNQKSLKPPKPTIVISSERFFKNNTNARKEKSKIDKMKVSFEKIKHKTLKSRSHEEQVLPNLNKIDVLADNNIVLEHKKEHQFKKKETIKVSNFESDALNTSEAKVTKSIGLKIERRKKKSYQTKESKEN